LAALPKPLRERAEKLPVTFERQPNADLQADGIEPDTLGLFTGPEFADEENVPMPPQIILFLENIWEFAEARRKTFCVKFAPLFCTSWDIIWAGRRWFDRAGLGIAL
jgi:hypothetical protein